MRLHTTLMTAAAALALGMGPALAADEAPGASSDITIVERDCGQRAWQQRREARARARTRAPCQPLKRMLRQRPGTTGGLSDQFVR